MKSKIRFIIVACFIAGVAVTGFNMAQNHNSLDVSLADIAVMARADSESGSTYNCVYNVQYGGLGFVRQCSTCGWAWFISSFSGTGSCIK